MTLKSLCNEKIQKDFHNDFEKKQKLNFKT